MSGSDLRNICISIFIFLIVGSVFLFAGRECWFDESYSILYAQKPVSEMLAPQDVHAPSYYIFLHFWIGLFGISNVALRVSSLLVGILAIIYLYKIFKRFFPERDQWPMWAIITLIFTLSTNFMHYFTEIRMYAWAVTFGLMSFYYMFMMCDSDYTKYKWEYIVSVIFFLAFHYYSMIYFMLQVFYIAARSKLSVDFIKKTWKSFAVLAIFVCGYILYFIAQKARTDIILFQVSTWWSLLSTYYHYFFHHFEFVIPMAFTITGLIFVFGMFGLSFWSIDKYQGQIRKDIIFLLLVAMIPPVLGMLVNIFIVRLYHHRYFILGAWSALFLLSGALFKIYEKRKLILFYTIITLIIALMVCNLVNYFKMSDTELVDGYQGMLSRVGCHSGAYVVHESPASLEPTLYYDQIYGCDFKQRVIQNMTINQQNAIGYDAINRSYYKIDTLDGINDFYYYNANDRIDTSGFRCVDIFNMTGIKISRCLRYE